MMLGGSWDAKRKFSSGGRKQEQQQQQEQEQQWMDEGRFHSWAREKVKMLQESARELDLISSSSDPTCSSAPPQQSISSRFFEHSNLALGDFLENGGNEEATAAEMNQLSGNNEILSEIRNLRELVANPTLDRGKVIRSIKKIVFNVTKNTDERRSMLVDIIDPVLMERETAMIKQNEEMTATIAKLTKEKETLMEQLAAGIPHPQQQQSGENNIPKKEKDESLSSMKKKLSLAEDKIAQLARDLTALQQQQQRKSSSTFQNKQTNVSSLFEPQANKNNNNNNDEEIFVSLKDVAMLRHELQEQMTQVSVQADEEIRKLAAEKSILSQELYLLKSSHKQHHKQLITALAETQNVTQEMAEMRANFDVLQQENSKLTSLNDNLSQELTETKGKLSKLRTQNETLKAELRMVQKK